VAGYIGLLQAYSWQGRFDLMWPWHIKAIASDPEDFELWASFSFYAEMLGDSELADRYIDRAVAFGPGEPAVLSTQACILSLDGNNDKAVEIARQALQAELDDRWGSNQMFLRLVRDDALRTGAFDGALAWYRTRHPEFFAVLPEITFGNIVVAADLALLLRRAGKPEAADVLINTALAWYRETQIPGVHGELTNIVDVELLALNGEKDAAINSLREAVDGGWRNLWKWHLGNENLASLHGEPGFQAIIEQLENDMAAQLEAIHALPYMGEFDLRSAQSHRWSNSHQ
jgi:tetratricopeptide (TPR) repeat protein